MSVENAIAVLRRGGIIAYPTEGVFGLGCLPDDLAAVKRLLEIKQRDRSKGLILLAADASLLTNWIKLPKGVNLPAPDSQHPTTWIVPASDNVSDWVRGDNEGIAVRISTHPVARSISDKIRSPLISTSANIGGQPVATSHNELRRQWNSLVDYIVPGDCGPSGGPSEIRELATGAVLRPAAADERN